MEKGGERKNRGDARKEALVENSKRKKEKCKCMYAYRREEIPTTPTEKRNTEKFRSGTIESGKRRREGR